MRSAPSSESALFAHRPLLDISSERWSERQRVVQLSVVTVFESF